MGQTFSGVLKTAAKKLGITFDEYIINIKNGLKWCTGCKEWHNYTEFGLDSSRRDGFNASCIKYRKVVYKKTYKPKPRISRKGKWVATTRDGDKKQARARVNILVRTGLLPNPNDLVCSKCGGDKEAKRNEYHHHNGYGISHHEDVIVLCTMCHSDDVSGEKNSNAKLTNLQVLEIRKLRKRNIEVKKIAEIYGTSKHAIENIIYGKTYKNVI